MLPVRHGIYYLAHLVLEYRSCRHVFICTDYVQDVDAYAVMCVDSGTHMCGFHERTRRLNCVCFCALRRFVDVFRSVSDHSCRALNVQDYLPTCPAAQQSPLDVSRLVETTCDATTLPGLKTRLDFVGRLIPPLCGFPELHIIRMQGVVGVWACLMGLFFQELLEVS